MSPEVVEIFGSQILGYSRHNAQLGCVTLYHTDITSYHLPTFYKKSI